jgi:hypothetical protein
VLLSGVCSNAGVVEGSLLLVGRKLTVNGCTVHMMHDILASTEEALHHRAVRTPQVAPTHDLSCVVAAAATLLAPGGIVCGGGGDG